MYRPTYWAIFSNSAVQLQVCYNKVELSWVWVDISTAGSKSNIHTYIHGYIHGYPYPLQAWLLHASSWAHLKAIVQLSTSDKWTFSLHLMAAALLVKNLLKSVFYGPTNERTKYQQPRPRLHKHRGKCHAKRFEIAPTLSKKTNDNICS